MRRWLIMLLGTNTQIAILMTAVMMMLVLVLFAVVFTCNVTDKSDDSNSIQMMPNEVDLYGVAFDDIKIQPNIVYSELFNQHSVRQ